MKTDESGLRLPEAAILEKADDLALDSIGNVLAVSDTLTDLANREITRERAREVCEQQLGEARSNRMAAVILALTTNKHYDDPGTAALKFRDYPAEGTLQHFALKDHYRLCEVVRALAEGRISVYDFGYACSEAQEAFEKYRDRLDGDAARPKQRRESPEVEAENGRSRTMWHNETTHTIKEVKTYQLAAAALLTTIESKKS
jgi:hypothetical protein